MESIQDARPLLDEQFDALAYAERRHLLTALWEENSQDGVSVEIGESRDDTESFERSVAMQHSHLPKLEDLGFIQWDRENSLVTEGPRFENLEPFLAFVHERRGELTVDRR